MTWWAIGISAASTLGGAAISASGSRSAANTAAAGSAAEQELIRESRDIARADQGPYREAGYKALDALMSMTGLAAPSAPGGGAPPGQAPAGPANNGALTDPRPPGLRIPGGPNFNSAYNISGGRTQNRALGGPMGGGTIYNVNETGPERVYQNGSYTRSNMPKTIAPSGDGYVAPNYYQQPNIQGAGFGSFFKKMLNPINASRPIRTAMGKDPYPNLMGGGGGGEVGMSGPDRIQGGPANPGPPSPNQNFGDPVAGTYQTPGENPGGVAGGYNFQTEPGYNFRLGEGQRVLERGAAAAGGLLSGGYGRRAIRYGQDYASNEYANVYNRISNIAGLGQTAAGQSGNAALMAGQGMGTAAAQGAYASAYGQQASGNAWANAGNAIARLPWGGGNRAIDQQLNPMFNDPSLF